MDIQVEVYKAPSFFTVIFLLIYRVHSQVCDQNPCPGGGVCLNTQNECMCSENYFGNRCQIYNDCSVQPCFGTSTCGGVTSPYGYECKCDGLDFTCSTKTCANNPCKSIFHTCSESTNEPGTIRCVCPEGYFGDNCELSNGCSMKQCPPGSTCTWYINPTAFTCTCTETGCDYVSNPCPSGYTSTVFSNPDRYACTCPTGYSGIDCSNYEGCASNPCTAPLVCTMYINSYACTCPTGYSGNDCSTYSGCASNPCPPHQVCIMNTNSYTCTCPTGYAGGDCSTYSGCASNPCTAPLVCTMRSNSYACTCPTGYSGIDCNTYSGCASNPCPDHQVCTMYTNSYTCTCPTGYSGNDCSTYNGCAGNPCPPHQVCILNTNSYACTCPTGYSGGDCSTYSGCLSNPCLVEYECSEFSNPDRYICTCPAGYSGNDCSIYSGCLSNPCLNGYVCLVLSNPYRYVCTCPTGYTGRDCGNYEGCLSNPCQHNSTCELYSDLEKYVCACPIGYRGVHCEEFKDPCLDSPCLNNGICETIDGLPHCICEDVFTGEFCEEIVICDSVICNVGGVCINSDKEQSCYYKTEHSVPLYFVVLLVISISVIASLTVYIVYKRISKNKKRVKEPMNDGRDYDAVIKNVMETKSASTFGVIQHSDISDKPSDMTIELKDTTKKDSSYEIPHTYMSIDPQYTDLIK